MGDALIDSQFFAFAKYGALFVFRLTYFRSAVSLGVSSSGAINMVSGIISIGEFLCILSDVRAPPVLKAYICVWAVVVVVVGGGP